MVECLYCQALIPETPASYREHMIKNHVESEAYKVWYFRTKTRKERIVDRVEQRLIQEGRLI